MKRISYRLQYASNLNVHMMSVIQARQLLNPVAPNLVLLGDIGIPNCRKTSEFFSWCGDNYEKVYWIPGFLEMSDSEGTHNWNERIEQCCETVQSSPTVKVTVKHDVLLKEHRIQLLLTTLWHTTDKPIYTYTRQGPKQMTFQDFNELTNSDMSWLLQTSAKHSLPIVWMTYSSPFLGGSILNYPKLLCSLQGTSDYIKNTGHFKEQYMWSSINMGGHSGFLKDAFWEHTVEKLEPDIMNTARY